MEMLRDVGYTRIEWTRKFDVETESRDADKICKIVKKMLIKERDIYYGVYNKFSGVYKQTDRQLIKNYLNGIDRCSLVETK